MKKLINWFQLPLLQIQAYLVNLTTSSLQKAFPSPTALSLFVFLPIYPLYSSKNALLTLINSSVIFHNKSLFRICNHDSILKTPPS